MRDELAKLVFPVADRGLALRELLMSGETPALETEQAALVGLLQAERAGHLCPDFSGDAHGEDLTAAQAGPGGGGKSPFLGARYALVCWLDETFILSSAWAERWNEHKLEVRLYGGNDRAWRFWEQAQLALDRQSGDALEVFFLCVMLGFTGEMIDEPTKLTEWCAAVRQRLIQSRTSQWRSPPEREPGTHVPPLTGRQQLRRMLTICSSVFLLLAPVVALVLAIRLSR